MEILNKNDLASYLKVSIKTVTYLLFSKFTQEEFLPWCKSRKTKSEYNRTLHTINLMQNYFGPKQLNEITPKLIEDYINWRKKKSTN